MNQINVFFEIDEGVAGNRLTAGAKVQMKASSSTVFEYKPDQITDIRHAAMYGNLYAVRIPERLRGSVRRKF